MDTIREYSDIALLLAGGQVHIYEDIEAAITTYEK
jgi:ABC-type polysaccharide/polyol phosphate transport system ATPase subunit